MEKKLSALILEDSENDALLLLRELGMQGFELEWERVCTAPEMQASLEQRSWDVVLSDYSMPGFDAPAALRVLQESGQDLTFIVISGTVGEDVAVATMKQGAHDYLMKGKLKRLGAAIEREVRDAGIRRDHRRDTEKIRHLNRVLRAIRNVNQLIVQEKDPTRLIERTCDLLIETRGYASAVLVRTDNALRPGIVAHSLAGGASTQVSVDAIRNTGLPTCMKQALRSTGAVVIDSNAPECADCPIDTCHSGLQRVAHGLAHEGRSFGVLSIALPEDMILDAAELDLFGEVVGDIAFALRGIEQEDAGQRARKNEQLANVILEHLNRPLEGESSIRQILTKIQKYGDFEAAGIRLQEEDDFPYYEVRGFPASFVAAERYLCARDAKGEVVRDSAGNAVLECMCGNVIKGRTDSSKTFFTERGSFWTNGTTDLLATTTDDDRQARTRNRCNGEGYESVALIPLRSGDETIGLLQINDSREDMFTLEMIEFLEDIGASIGIALGRVQAENALRESEERFRTLFEHAADSIFLLEITPESLAVIRDANPTTFKLLGYERHELIGQPMSFLNAEPNALDKTNEIRRNAVSGMGATVEMGHRCKDGTIRPFECSVTEFRIGPKTFAISVERDISERRRMQAQMAQSDRLVSMGMLAAGVAHEINNPLSYVLYNLESLTDDLPKLSAALRKCLEVVVHRLGQDEWTSLIGVEQELLNPAMLEDMQSRFQDALGGTRRIKDVARGLGTFSRVEDDRLVPVNLMHVIEVAINMAFNEIKYRARLVKEYGKVSAVPASDGRLSQVFLNLLINAAHAIEEGDVEGNEIRVRTWQEGDEVFAEVRDSGKGISAEQLSHLFEPFFTTKELGAGTGLGLPISKNIVDGYGGRIDVKSAVGKGTSFVVCLPIRRQQEASETAPETARDTEPVRRGRILVVDDEPAIRSAVVRMLKGHDVVEAASGAAGREILEADQAFDLILCDLMMPVLSGVDLHEWLSVAHPDLADKVVFVTGGAFTPKAREYLARVDNLQLEKPFEVADFKKMVDERIRAATAPV